MRRHEITDDHWDRIKEFLPGQAGDPGVTAKDNRLFVNAVLWIAKTGAPWRDLPEHFGAWQSVWERHRRWSDDGTYVRMFAAVRAAAPERDEQLRSLLSIDSTIARAHQHSAGALHEGHTGGPVE